MSGELFGRAKVETGKTILRTAYNLEVVDPSNRLGEIASFLGQGGNLLMYSNHIAFDDPVIETLFYTRFIDPKRERHYIIPASHWHTDPKNNKVFYEATKAAEFFFDADVYRLIQNYMVNNIDYGTYTPQDASDNHYSFFSKLRKLKKENIPTSMLIFPEGHRSEDGILQPIEAGFETAGRIMSPTVCVPLAIHYDTPYSRNGLNIRTSGHRPQLTIGEPHFIHDRSEKTSTKFLMQNLARALPPNMRGPYSSI